jgi:hypothetical protein
MPSGFLRRVRSVVLTRDGSLADTQLLACFTERRDPAAFEALLRRHGPMVLGVCRRILGDSHDADDAFQAVFLIFVRKAGSIALRETVRGLAVRRGVPHCDCGAEQEGPAASQGEAG